MTRPSPRPILALLTLAAVALVVGGCALTVPKADATPPTVSMLVGGLGAAFPVSSTTGPVNRTAPAGAEIVMLASGTDTDGGVKDVRISGALTVSCSGGELGQAVSVHYFSGNPEDPEVGPGDEAKDRRFTNLTIKIDDLATFCGNGFTFSGASGGFVASAENFHGGTASTPPFSFTHP